MASTKGDWQAEFEAWLAPFLARLRRVEQRRWAPIYLQGLLGPGERKSIEPMAARVAPADVQQLHHFISTSPWTCEPLEEELVRAAERLLGGPDAVLVIDDTALVKQGRHSVGVHRQYCGQLGKKANCQALVSLTLARAEVPVCVGLRLFLPRAWAENVSRRTRAGVPEAIVSRPKWQLALDELDRIRAAGARFGCVLADAEYGKAADFRHALSDEMWRAVLWRRGTKGDLRADFAALRIRVADGPVMSGAQHRPGEEAWLVCERRGSGERKYYLTNHAEDVSLESLAALIKARWVCEQAHQQMKEDLGLDHFEGRSWLGLHHHGLMTMIAFAFLQHLRLGGKNHHQHGAAASSISAPGPTPSGGYPEPVRAAVPTLSSARALPSPPLKM